MAMSSNFLATILFILFIAPIPFSVGQVNVTTVAPQTTTNGSIVVTTTSPLVTTMNRTVITTEAPRTSILTTANITSPTTTTTTTTTTTPRTTTRPPGRKFDGLSFIGGMILAVGLTAITYLVVTYRRRQQSLPYGNLP